MKLVVNVDDLGLHPAVQRAVARAAEAGVVTSASLLANGPATDDARDLNGVVGIGAHLNILRGAPLSPPQEVRSLLTREGRFAGAYGPLFRRYLFGRIDVVEVECEWERQIARLRDAGFSLTHLDSEKHIHCWPRLMPIACRLAKRFGIRWVRRVRERAPLRMVVGAARAKLLTFWARSHEPVEGVRWPDAVWGIAAGGEALDPEALRGYLRGLEGAGVVEVICHPGDPQPEDPPVPEEFGRLRAPRAWAVELARLLEGNWLDMFREEGAILVDYGRIDGA